jgi:ADP-ribose pyrophosphatase
VLPEADVLAGLANGAYNNAATIVCLQWLALNRDRLHGLTTHGRRDP